MLQQKIFLKDVSYLKTKTIKNIKYKNYHRLFYYYFQISI